jgi:hypothetical protein
MSPLKKLTTETTESTEFFFIYSLCARCADMKIAVARHSCRHTCASGINVALLSSFEVNLVHGYSVVNHPFFIRIQEENDL